MNLQIIYNLIDVYSSKSKIVSIIKKIFTTQAQSKTYKTP